MKPITAIIVLSLVVASLLVAGCTTSTNDQTTSASATPSVQSDKTTFSSDKGYSITYPATWEKSVAADPPVDVYLYVSPNEKANGVVVGTESLASGTTLNEFVNAQIATLKNYNSSGVYKNLAILSETDSTLSGKPAHTVVFSGIFPVQYSTTT